MRVTTLHIQVTGRNNGSTDRYSTMEQRYSRAQSICAHMKGSSSMPRGITADVYAGGRPFFLLSPKGYIWNLRDQITCFLCSGNGPADVSPKDMFWALTLLEQEHTPVFVLPMGQINENPDISHQYICETEHNISSILQGAAKPLHLFCHGETAYAGYLMLMREERRRTRDRTGLFTGDLSMTALFGGSISSSLPEREELRQGLRDLPFRISLIALAEDPAGTAADIIKTWPDTHEMKQVTIDLVKPAFHADSGIFPPSWNTDELSRIEGDASVISDTRQSVRLSLEAMQMVCLLLARR